ncbi:MAG: DUF3261 domain-containing protein [Treponema sp.]|nr:DUF3261 domain-containing protein [Treponema sp.]
MNSKKSVIIFFLCCCSCASKVAVKENRSFIYLTGSSQFFLLPSGDIENPLDMAQRISASWQGRDYFLNAWVKADNAGMEITLLNELGATIGELSCRNGLVSFSSPVFPPSLKPEYIVADFQLCFYNTSALRQALEDCGLLLETSENSRRILQGKTVIIEIEKNQNTVRLINHLRGYAYTLEGNFK